MYPPSSEQQGSFSDPEYVCEQLIPADSFYRQFRKRVRPVIKDEMFASMYSLDSGLPPIAPS